MAPRVATITPGQLLKITHQLEAALNSVEQGIAEVREAVDAALYTPSDIGPILEKEIHDWAGNYRRWNDQGSVEKNLRDFTFLILRVVREQGVGSLAAVSK